MLFYADSSFVGSLYFQQRFAPLAERMLRRYAVAPLITELTRIEIRSVSFHHDGGEQAWQRFELDHQAREDGHFTKTSLRPVRRFSQPRRAR